MLDTLSAYQVHLFESSVAPEGAIATAAWVDYWRELHRGFNASRADVWDAYMWNSQTFYAPDLTPFVRRLRGARVPMLCASYDGALTPISGRFANSVTLYSASVVVPGTGHLVEVVSEHVDASLQGPFGAWPGASCPAANEITQAVSDLRSLWVDNGGRMANDFGLPDLLVVKASFPGDVDAFAALARDVLRSDDVTKSAAVYASDDDLGAAPRDDGGAVNASERNDSLCVWSTLALGEVRSE